MSIGNGQNPNLRSANKVSDVIWKYPQIYATIASRAQMRKLVVPRYPHNMPVHFDSKTLAQTILLLLVIGNRILKFGPGLWQNLDGHAPNLDAISFLISS